MKIKMIRLFYLFVFMAVVESCAKGYGNKLTAENLTVYFDSPDLENKANALGKFWIKKGLVGDREQHIKLSQSKNTYFIHLIQSEEFRNYPVTFAEQKLLLQLQTELDSMVFMNGNQCEIILCDSDFQMINK
jgi:hypothetical protein